MLMFQRSITPGIKEVVAVCSNPPCNAMFDLQAGGMMKLRDCEDKSALAKYPDAMPEAEWVKIFEANTK
jgi:hypothetical protein